MELVYDSELGVIERCFVLPPYHWKDNYRACKCTDCRGSVKHRPLKRLIRWRKRQRLTQKKAAARFHMSQSNYAAIEGGKRLAPDHILRAIGV